MALKDLVKILEQVHEPDEYKLVPHNMIHTQYWIWKLKDGKLKDLDLEIRQNRPEHARFDVFVNGQYVLEADYDFEVDGSNLLGCTRGAESTTATSHDVQDYVVQI